MYQYLIHLSYFSMLSFFSNFILIILTKNKFFGVSINNNLQKLLKMKYFFLYYFIFIFFLLLIVKFYFAQNTIYLDTDKISISPKMGDFDLAISLKDTATLFNHFCEPAVFIGLARIGY
jgi:hypothetical protein